MVNKKRSANGMQEFESDESLRRLFETMNTIAVIGIKQGDHEDAFRVPRYMQNAGYKIRPVNPNLDRILGEDCVDRIGDLQGEQSNGATIDVVNIFRAPDNIPPHVDEILALNPRPRVVWMQLGIQHGPSAERLREAGIDVVQDRCIMVDHRRLVGSESQS